MITEDYKRACYKALIRRMGNAYPDGYTCDSCGKVATLEIVDGLYIDDDPSFINLTPVEVEGAVICYECFKKE